MTTQNNESHPFWSGFVVGGLVGTGLMYLLGTKKGRETAHKLLENTDNFEQTAQEILNFLRETDLFNANSSGKDTNPINTIIDKMTTMTQSKESKNTK